MRKRIKKENVREQREKRVKIERLKVS